MRLEWMEGDSGVIEGSLGSHSSWGADALEEQNWTLFFP